MILGLLLVWGWVLLKTNELFDQFLSEIQDVISPTSYNCWFSEISLVKMENNKVTILVPFELNKKMLLSTYYHTVETTFYSITGDNYDIEFLTQEELDSIDKKKDESKSYQQLSTSDNVEDNVTIEWNTNLKDNLNFENFIVGDTNRLAYISSRSVAEAPGTIHNPFFLYGKSGLGKTHLIHSIGNYITNNSNKKVLYTTSSDFRDDYIEIAKADKGVQAINYANAFKNKYRNVDVLIIDDIQFLVGSERTQQEFFQTFNALHQMNKQIIITSDKSPDDLQRIEDRLTSRFKWGLPVNVNPPDFALRLEIIKNKIKLYSIDKKINNDALEYIATNCKNDVRHIEGAINRLMIYTAMMIPSVIDLNFAVEALKDYVNTNVYSRNTVENIQSVVAKYFQIEVADMIGKKRVAKIIRPRHIAMYLSREETDENLVRIGLEFGGRDHSTIIAACEKIKKDMKNDDDLIKMLKDIREML